MSLTSITEKLPLGLLSRFNVLPALKEIDVKILIKGLCCVFAFYAVAYVYVLATSSSTIQKLEDKLAHETVPIKTIAPDMTPALAKTQATLIDGLAANSEYGLIPIIRPSDNLTSFRAYQAPFSFKNLSDKPVLSFVLLDYGLSKKLSELALKTLPAEVSFMLSPYAINPQNWINKAQRKGHEVWLHIPIQNEKGIDQGKNIILHHASVKDKHSALKSNLSQALGYVGIASYTDNTLNGAREDYGIIVDDVYNRGLGFLELNPDAEKEIQAKALAKGAPYIKSDMQVLQIKGKESFDLLETKAKKQGASVARVPSYPNTIKILGQWIEKIGRTDYTIAPVSAIYDLPAQRAAQNRSTPGVLSPADQDSPKQN